MEGVPKKPEGETIFQIEPHYDEPEGSPMRDIGIPNVLLEAERRFEQILPDLLDAHRDKWVFVAWDGNHGFGTDPDDAEIAALHLGYKENEYVVRMVDEGSIEDEITGGAMGGF